MRLFNCLFTFFMSFICCMPLYVHAKIITLPGGIHVNVYDPLAKSDTYFGKNVTVPTSVPLVGGREVNIWQCTQLIVILKYVTGIEGKTIDDRLPGPLTGYLYQDTKKESTISTNTSTNEVSRDVTTSGFFGQVNGIDGAPLAGIFHSRVYDILNAGQLFEAELSGGKSIDSIGIQCRYDLNSLLTFASIVAMKQIENSIVHGISKRVGWNEQVNKREQEYIRAGIKSVFLAISVYAKGGLQPLFTWQKTESDEQPNTIEPQQSIIPIAPPLPQSPQLPPNKSLSTDTTKKGSDTQTFQQDTSSTSNPNQQLLQQIKSGDRRTQLRHVADEDKKNYPKKSDMQQSLEDGLEKIKRANSDDPQVSGLSSDDSEWD